MEDAGLTGPGDQRLGSLHRGKCLFRVAGGDRFLDAAHFVAHARALRLVDGSARFDLADGFFRRFRVGHTMGILERG